MKSVFYQWLGTVLLAAALTAQGQTFTFTTATFGDYAVNGSGTDPAIKMTGGSTYTLQVLVSPAQPLFLTAAYPPRDTSPNYYSVNPGAFSSMAMSVPVTNVTVNFTPPVSNTVFYLYYVDYNQGDSGQIEVDPPTVYPDTTSTITISRPIVPTNGPATVTVVPRVNGNIVEANSSIFAMSVSTGGGSISGLSPQIGTNFTAAYDSAANTGTFTISDGYGASVPVSVIKSLPLTGFTLARHPGAAPLLSASGFSNATYQVLMSTNLSVWTSLGAATSSANGLLQYTDIASPYPVKRFYRLGYP